MLSRSRPSTFKDWTLKELKTTYISLDNSIFGANACYGCKDMLNLLGIERELNKRGYSVAIAREQPKFVKGTFE